MLAVYPESTSSEGSYFDPVVADIIARHNKQVCARTFRTCRRQAASQKQARRVGSITFCVHQADSVLMKCIARSDPNQA